MNLYVNSVIVYCLLYWFVLGRFNVMVGRMFLDMYLISNGIFPKERWCGWETLVSLHLGRFYLFFIV